MTKKTIAIDLDGTLLRSDGTISDYTVAIIKKIQEQGHLVIISTGRPYRMALEFYKILGLKTPMINFNGSLIHIPEQKWAGEHRVKIERKYLFEVLKNEKAFEADFIASEYRKKFYLTFNHRQTIKPEIFGVKELTDKMQLKPEKITRDPHALLMQTRVEDKYALADDMRRHFNHEMEISSWGGPMNILEFSPKGVNKAYALKHLLKTLNLSKEDLIAFGDEHNDRQMLAFASVGYAMKNASQVLLPYADKMTAFDNDHDGVAKELKKLLL
ncbi:Cof-type HAD-IIB family hydrolase [Streptococcus caviae]|uniref:Cof-type HAD-IIB family hydrolase n=1 Tax=Streptococcus sp. 'caviae' TaxID=1915004 RepID=UPI00094BB94A|nr:Cof-type HAD-IIB family hydrolase [Streptococcus sp. 'caviae']OLN84591.1 HAD family hydrolase [Streptococcus sp. 'caviae']